MKNFTLPELAEFINTINKNPVSDIRVKVGEPVGGVVGGIAKELITAADFEVEIKARLVPAEE